MTGSVFNIQRFSTHDGPGIRTTVFLKGCPLRCFWCQNPESQIIRPVLLVKQDACIGCGRCVEMCPAGACVMVDGKILVDRKKCTICGKCADLCLNSARSVAGYEITPEDVMQIVLRDRAMYRNSGGGMTLSGGEVTAQWQFSLELLRLAKQECLHTAIETCGYCRWDILEQLLEYTDYVMYDIKCVDSERHKYGTGIGNELILENAKKVAQTKEVLFRMPLIPGYNDMVEYVAAFARFVREETGLGSSHIELLQYNNLGEEKFNRLGRNDEKPTLERQSDEYMAQLQAVATAVFAQAL